MTPAQSAQLQRRAERLIEDAEGLLSEARALRQEAEAAGADRRACNGLKNAEIDLRQSAGLMKYALEFLGQLRLL